MLIDRRRKHYLRLLLFYGGLAWIGQLSGNLWQLLTFALALHLFWYMVQVHWLIDWLRDFESETPHSAHGLWGDLLDYLWQFRRRQRSDVRRLEKNLQRIQDSVESLSDGLVIITRHGELQWWNEAAETMLGLRDGDVGQSITSLVRDPKFVNWFRVNRWHGQLELTNPRTHHILEITNNRHAGGNRLLLVRDVTRLRRLEQMRQDFVANASHELRTPLTVLQGYLEGFSDHRDSLPPRTHRAIDQMQSQTRRMGNLVNDLLLLTRLDSAEASPQTEVVDITAMMESIAADARELSGDKGQDIRVQSQSSQRLLGVASELRSAFSNLVFNAVHYTPAEGTITLQWRTDESGGYFDVIDNGVGIDKKHIHRLTERFYRVDPSRSSETGGTGLGLAIVKHALAHHEGQLQISSRLGVGSTFTCYFPASVLVSAGAAPAAKRAAG